MYEQDLHQKRALKFAATHQGVDQDEESLEIEKVEVLGEEPGLNPLPNDQTVQVRIHYTAFQQIGKAHVSVFIKRSDGLTCCMMRTKLDNFELFLERGRGVISLYLEPLQLITGNYFAEAWFLNESDSMGIVSRAGRSDWFSVKGSVLSYADDSGVFEPNTRWSHQSEVHASQI
jgi:hypothetical protein